MNVNSGPKNTHWSDKFRKNVTLVLRPFPAFVSLALLGAILFTLDSRHGLKPPLGRFLDPFGGVWRNARNESHKETLPFAQSGKLNLNGLRSSVKVLRDERGVSHLFASNEADFYFAQGYVTARDRLFQMDFLARLSLGRLSEIFGKATEASDVFQRKMGMPQAAQSWVDALDDDPEMKGYLKSFVDGVNTYVSTLSTKDFPVEYKMFDFKPELWTGAKTAALLKLIAFDLTGKSALNELRMTNNLSKYSESVLAGLFPLPSASDAPIIPSTTTWDFQGDRKAPPSPGEFKPFFVDVTANYFPAHATMGGLGSNNWVISGKKSASGFPILENDPHLRLTLPSIWYETQISGPNTNVYGVTIPGIPGILIGFNNDISWGITSGYTDVADWYRIRFKDETREKYLFDGVYRDTRKVTEVVQVRDAPNVQFDVVYTHHGPIVIDTGSFGKDNVALALRWAGHDRFSEMRAFHLLDRARNYDEYTVALKFIFCPNLNVNFASRSGDIAIWHVGLIPKRSWGQGVAISDGTQSSFDWKGFIPPEEHPNVLNPERGFLQSANQFPVSSNYPYFLVGEYSPPWRGERIKDILSENRKFTTEDFRKMQLDTKNLFAEKVRPHLLKLVDLNALSEPERAAFNALSHWDDLADGEETAPMIFNVWWTNVMRRVWKDSFGDEYGNYKLPSREVTADLVINHPDSRWFVSVKNPKETISDKVTSALKDAVKAMQDALGPQGPAWRLGKAKGVDLDHLTRLPVFSQLNLFAGGGEEIVNAIKKHAGPSWRMIVTMHPDGPEAYGAIPGGVEGEPGSVHYTDGVKPWLQGELFRLHYLKPSDAGMAVASESSTGEQKETLTTTAVPSGLPSDVPPDKVTTTQIELTPEKGK